MLSVIFRCDAGHVKRIGTGHLFRSITIANLLIKKFNLNKKKEIKPQIKSIIQKKSDNIRKLESIFHPLVRKKMNNLILYKKQNF